MSVVLPSDENVSACLDFFEDLLYFQDVYKELVKPALTLKWSELMDSKHNSLEIRCPEDYPFKTEISYLKLPLTRNLTSKVRDNARAVFHKFKLYKDRIQVGSETVHKYQMAVVKV